MPQFDRVFKARLGTDTTVNPHANHAIWVRAVHWKKEALVHIAQLPDNAYLSPDEAREFAAYLVDLAGQVEAATRLQSLGDSGVMGVIDIKPDEGQS